MQHNTQSNNVMNKHSSLVQETSITEPYKPAPPPNSPAQKKNTPHLHLLHGVGLLQKLVELSCLAGFTFH